MSSRASRLLSIGLVLAAFAAAGCGGGGAGGAGGAGELVVGVYGSMTGTDADFGQSTRKGVDLALDEFRARGDGTMGGMPIRVVIEDDQGRAEEAATVVQKLINQDRVFAVLGEVASGRSLAAAPICQAAGVPMITPSSTNPKVTEVGDFIFRMCFIDPFQGTVMAKFAAEDLGLKRVAILKDVGQEYSVGLSEFFKSAFLERGGSIVVEQAYSGRDQDFRAQLTAIKARNPEAIFLPGYYNEAGLIARQARELGITVPILGGDGWESDQLISIGGEALEGCFYSNHFAADNPDTTLQSFLQRYREKHGNEPNSIGGLAYDAANVLLEKMADLHAQDPAVFAALGSSKAGTPERTAATRALRDLIAATRDFNGVTGRITLDENRNATKAAMVLAIQGGKKVYRTTIAP